MPLPDAVDASSRTLLPDAGLDNGGRPLTIFPSVGLVTNVAGRLLDDFLGSGAGLLLNGIAGSDAFPIEFGALIDSAVKQIDRLVGEQIEEVSTHCPPEPPAYDEHVSSYVTLRPCKDASGIVAAHTSSQSLPRITRAKLGGVQ